MATIIYTPKGPLSWFKKTNSFSGELSDLRINPDEEVTILNPKTGASKVFKFTHKDMDGSNEDCYGYNYRSSCGLKLLLIND